MGGFGAHRALPPHPFRHFLDEMGYGGNFLPLALRHLQSCAGERRLDLGAGHSMRSHDAVSPMLRLPHSGGNRRAAEPNIWRQLRIAPPRRGIERVIDRKLTNRPSRDSRTRQEGRV